MNASRFMDKQIMDLSRSSLLTDNNNNIDQHHQDQVVEQQVEEEDEDLEMKKNNQEILPNYDFHPIHRPPFHSHNHSNNPISSPLRSYSSLDHNEPDTIVVEKSQKVNDSPVLFEIDRTMQKHTDTLMHAIDSLSARLTQMEGRTRQLEHSVTDLRVSVDNNCGSADGKLRQLENILLEVKTGVLNLKDKQEIFEGHMQLAKLQISNSDQSSQLPNSDQDPVQQAPSATAPPQGPQQSEFQQFPVIVPQPLASPHAFPLSQHNIHPPLPQGAQRDSYLPPSTQTPDMSNQQYVPLPVQNQQPPPPAFQSQQYQPGATPPYPQPPQPQPPQQQHPSIVGGNAPQFQPTLGPMGHRPDDSSYAPRQTYPPNHYQPASQPISGPPQYGSPSSAYVPPPLARSSSSYPSSYGPPSGPTESFPYGGPTSHYGGGTSVKPQPHSPKGGTGNYPQLPTARVLPQAIPTASGVGSGSSSGGSGNKVPIDDVVDKVTNMGFSRDQVRATVRRLTENGQAVDLNIVLDKLMNDADVQPPRGWFGR